MHPLPFVSVSAVLLALLPGCGSIDSCGSGGTVPTTEDTTVDSAHMADAAGSDGVLSDDECAALCAQTMGVSQVTACSATEIADTGGDSGTDSAGDTGNSVSYTLECTGVVFYGCMGRPPAGLSRPRRAAPGIGPWAAQAASMEAASVRAFLDLGTALDRLGAPESLQQRARRAARDEVRHTQIMARIARAHRAPLVPAQISDVAAPDRAQLALENARSGCVQETWSALMARHQALHAPDPAVRAAMAEIAGDEATHADLAFAIQEWLAGAAGQGAVADAVATEIAAIRAGLTEQDDAEAAVLGLPSREAGVQLLDDLVKQAYSSMLNSCSRPEVLRD